jgi:hypothetical protein
MQVTYACFRFPELFPNKVVFVFLNIITLYLKYNCVMKVFNYLVVFVPKPLNMSDVSFVFFPHVKSQFSYLYSL